MSQVPVTPEFLQGLQEAQETYRHLVEGIPAILYIDAVDDLSSNIYTSPQILDLVGFTVEQWREEPNLWLARLHEDDRERVVAAHRMSNANGIRIANTMRSNQSGPSKRRMRSASAPSAVVIMPPSPVVMFLVA